MAGLKHSRQREAILDYLHSTKSHPTAEAVYWKVREDMDSIDSIDQLAGENFPGEILGHEIYFYGTCGDCLKLKNMKK